MKGKSLLALCLLLLMSCLSYARFGQTELKASGASLPVHDLNTGLNYSTIQNAINANETLNGDTIKVDPGVYYESFVVNKSLTLIGEDRNTTVIDGNGTGLPYMGGSAVIWLNSNSISLMNFTVRNGGPGNARSGHFDTCVGCIGQSNIDLENNTLQNAGAGFTCINGVSSIIINDNLIFNTTGLSIDVGGWINPTATNVTVTNNIMYNATQLGAINLDGDTSNCTVSNNTIVGCYQGIDVGYNIDTRIAPTNVTVGENFVQDCSAGGIELGGDTQNSTIFNNTVEGCDYGLRLINDPHTELAPYNNLIEGNILSNNNFSNLLYYGAGDIVDTQPSHTNTFRGNNLTNTQNFNVVIWGWDLGAFMQDIDDSNIANNQKIYYLTNLSNVNVDPSNLPDAGSLTLVNCTGITVKDFNFTQNNDGLLLAGSTGCTLTNVTVANNQIYDLNIYGTALLGPNNWGPMYGGLSLVYSTNNTIKESTMYNNTCGVWLCWSNGNIFYDNAFINNDYQVFNGMAFPTTPSTCSWNNTVEGNYWSDYNGSGIRQDGIGDTPYIANSTNIDYHPLLGEFNSFNITSQYTLQTVCNSTISDLQFNGTAITFNASGVTGTTGFCRISIPTALINGTLRVFVNGTETPYTLLPESNSTQDCLYFTYHHSTEQVLITMPEFPSFLILMIFITATLVAVTAFRRRHTKARAKTFNTLM